MKILVTGAAGFIGSKLMYRLAERGDEEGAAVGSNAVRGVVVVAGLERFADGVVTLVDEW